MSWLSIAAGFLRDAMSSEPAPKQADSSPIAPQTLDDLVGLLNQHRAEIDRNFDAVAQALAALNEGRLRAAQMQKRWNYGLAAALLITAGAAVIALFFARQ
jgi:hypothetical protein